MSGRRRARTRKDADLLDRFARLNVVVGGQADHEADAHRHERERVRVEQRHVRIIHLDGDALQHGLDLRDRHKGFGEHDHGDGQHGRSTGNEAR